MGGRDLFYRGSASGDRRSRLYWWRLAHKRRVSHLYTLSRKTKGESCGSTSFPANVFFPSTNFMQRAFIYATRSSSFPVLFLSTGDDRFTRKVHSGDNGQTKDPWSLHRGHKERETD